MMKAISKISVGGSPVFVNIDHLQIGMKQERMPDFADCTYPLHHSEVGLNEYLDEGKIPFTCCIGTKASI